MKAYYNEHDPKAAAWLRELILDKQIAPGDVDERDIRDILPSDLDGYSQCHFFAGIGGWSRALRLIDWPDTKPIWTGSCPCQPFSAAGGRAGMADERHLWPAFHWLIRQCRPGVVVGEQVESAVRHGWLDLVSGDLEAEDYAVGAVVLGAHSVGRPHLRQRLWWIGCLLADSQGKDRQVSILSGQQGDPFPESGGPSGPVGVALGDTSRAGQQNPRSTPPYEAADGRARWIEQSADGDYVVGCGGSGSRVADPDGGQSRNGGLQRSRRHRQQSEDEGVVAGMAFSERIQYDRIRHEGRGWGESPNSRASDWSWLPCLDGTFRPTERGLQPLVAKLPRGVVPSGDPGLAEYANATSEARIMRLRGYGNAIVPEVAAAFLEAALA